MWDVLFDLFSRNIRYNETSDEKPNDLSKCLRQEAAKWSCIFEISYCKDAATAKLKLHLSETKRYNVLNNFIIIFSYIYDDNILYLIK